MFDPEKWKNLARYIKTLNRTECPYCGAIERLRHNEIKEVVYCTSCYQEYQYEENKNNEI